MSNQTLAVVPPLPERLLGLKEKRAVPQRAFHGLCVSELCLHIPPKFTGFLVGALKRTRDCEADVGFME